MRFGDFNVLSYIACPRYPYIRVYRRYDIQMDMENTKVILELAGKKSNHSLRASGTTAMFAAQVPEKMMKEETGHKSSKALAIYECPTYAQWQALPKVLAGGPESSSSTFSEDIAKLKPVDEFDAIVSQLLLDYLYLETNILDFAAVLLLPAYLVFVILPWLYEFLWSLMNYLASVAVMSSVHC